jgi:hypothetical protein
MSGPEIKAAGRACQVAAAFGGWGGGAILIVRATDTRHLEETLARIREADGILRTQTSVVLSTLIDRPFAIEAEA